MRKEYTHYAHVVLVLALACAFATLSCKRARYDALFSLDCCIRPSDKTLYTKTRDIILEYRYDGKRIAFVTPTHLAPDVKARIARAFALPKDDRTAFFVSGPVARAIERLHPRFVYSEHDKDIVAAREACVTPIRVYTGREYENGAHETILPTHLLALTGPYGERILIQNEVRPDVRIPLTPSRIDVLDGDTIRYEGVTVRFLAIDAPEMGQSAGPRAKTFVATRITNAARVTLSPAEPGLYGRVLGHIFVDGESLSFLLVQNRLAYQTLIRYGDNGFPRLATRILDEARRVKRPPFLHPRTYKERERARREERESAASMLFKR